MLFGSVTYNCDSMQGSAPELEEPLKIGFEQESDYIISVMLPTKDQADSSYTSLEELYVVALNPNKKYTTYICGLKRPIFV